MKIRLTKQELSTARQSARMRKEISFVLTKQGYRDRAVNSGSEKFNRELLGVKAEIAVAKCLGVPFNPHAFGPDGGQDLWFGDFSIDVKSSKLANAQLVFEDKTQFRADIGVLVIQTDQADIMNIVGGIKQVDFFKDAERMQLRNDRSPAWCVPQSQLTSVMKMWAGLTQSKYA